MLRIVKKRLKVLFEGNFFGIKIIVRVLKSELIHVVLTEVLSDCPKYVVRVI